jgi:uncharacterized protein with HEPN domain/predicted nucleotidyltransferase
MAACLFLEPLTQMIRVSVPRQALDRFCDRHHVRSLALFGSVVRDDFGPDSDVDILVEFQSGHVPGFEFGGMGEELSELFRGRYVDLKTPACFRPETLRKVLSEAVLCYGPPFRGPRPHATHAGSGRKGSATGQKKNRTDFQQDELLQLALSRLVEMVGEAASRITQQTRNRHKKIPWPDIIGTRNRIVHDYYLVNLDVLWEIVTQDLRPLVGSLKRILKSKRKPPRKQG